MELMKLKFSPEVLLEIVSIVQTGICEEKDISQMLRGVETVPDEAGMLFLSDEYKKSRGV